MLNLSNLRVIEIDPIYPIDPPIDPNAPQIHSKFAVNHNHITSSHRCPWRFLQGRSPGPKLASTMPPTPKTAIKPVR
ncbi:MAG: hypothetical protein BJG00_013120 [Limnothrix sp. CACIAM 69d]|nr:MAG: hypothetical protein BJG00_013120 [Limnothrix sp. CACIAM 69d]